MAFTATSLGLLLSNMVKTPEQAMPALMISFMVQLALHGALFSI